MTFDLRLTAYSPGTDTALKVWTEPLTWSASVVHNNDGALTVKYSELADGGSIAARTLNQGLDVALEVNHSGTWTEPDNCRFLMVQKGYDRTDPAKVHEVTLPSWSWLLNKICDLNLGALAGAKSKQAGMRVFAATRDAGDVVKTMLDEHDARSGPAVPVIRSSWNTSHDSGGNAWVKKLGKNADGRAFPAGQPLHDKLDALVKNNLCDYRTRGRALRMYNQNSENADLSATIVLRYGDELGDAPSTTSQADRVARILVKGDGKHHKTEFDPAVPELYGRWEAMIDSSGVKDDDDLEDAGQAELSDRNRIKGEYTRTLTLAGSWLPFRDYNVGDWITAPGADGDERLRVMQITITRDEQNGLGGNIVLGDRFTNKDLALAGRVSAITGGTTGVIGNGTVGSTLPQDTRVPSAPTGLSVTGELYMNAFGEWRVRGRFSWAATSTATDGTDLDIAKYEILGQQQTTPTSVWRTIAATSANATTITKEEFLVASQWVFTVRAYGVSTTEPGTQSSTTSITFGTDTVAPNTPATPTATSYLGTGVVGWSGLDSGGGAMPLDFVRCEVHLSTTTGFTPSSATRKAAFLGGGTVTLSGLTYGTPYFVKLVAYDQSGNASTPSAQATFTPQQAVTADITQNAIDNTLLAPGAITNDKIAARSILASSMVLTDFANHVENPGFETGDLTGWTAPAGGWTTQVTAASHSGAYRAVCAAAGASRPLLSGTVVDVVPGDVWVVSAWAWTDLDGAGVAQIGMLFDTGTSVYPVSVPAVSSGWQRYTAAYTIPSGVKQAQFRIFFSATTGTLRLDDTYLRRANNAELIVDGSLTAIKMSSTDIFTINLYSGLPTGTHVRVTPNGGFSAWSANPAASGAIQSWARMGDSTSGDGLSIGFDAANPDAAIRSGGFASFQSVITEALRVKGDTLDTYLSRLPQGRNSYAESGSPTTGISTTETGIVELRAILQPGRTYSIAVENISVQSSAGAIQWRSNIRYALDGAAVSTASTGLRLNVTNYIHPSGVYLAQPDVNATMRTGAWGAAREVRLLFSAWLFTGSGTINTWGSSTQPLTLTVRDEGPDMAATTTQIAHVTVWNSSALYLGGAGSAQTSLYVNDTQIYAHALFNSNGVLGEAATVAAALSGATLLKAEAGVYVNNMWAYSTLGNNLPIRVAANTNTTAQSGLTSAGTSVASPNYAAPEFKWIDISSIFSTSSRSITLWDHIGNGSGNVYQVLNNATHPVQLRLTYLR